MFPPRLRRGTRHPDAPSLLASLRRASVRHPEGASGKHGAPAQTFSHHATHQNATASPAPHAKRQATKQHTKRRQPSPPRTQNTQPPSNTLNRDSPPPPQFARHGAHTKPPRTPTNRRDNAPLPNPQKPPEESVSSVVTSGCPSSARTGPL